MYVFRTKQPIPDNKNNTLCYAFIKFLDENKKETRFILLPNADGAIIFRTRAEAQAWADSFRPAYPAIDQFEIVNLLKFT